MRTTLQSAADKTMPAKTVPTVGVPSAPALPADLEALLRRLRLPHVRRHAPEVVATAKAQRCEPVETLKALLVEEVAGRERSALATRRSAAGFPTGKIHRTGRAAVAGRTGASTASLPGSTAPTVPGAGLP
jgi:hypothetical protein